MAAKGIKAVTIFNIVFCLSYMELSLLSGSWMWTWLESITKHWLGLIFAFYALIMLFGVDRRKWSEEFENNRRINNFLLVLSPCVAEALEPFREVIFEWAESHKEWWILLMVLVVWAFLVALVFWLDKKFHINKR